MSDAGKTFFISIYYPGYSVKHKHTHSWFVSDLENLFESLLNNEGRHVLLGEFDVHMEEDERLEKNIFQCMLREFKLSQHVKVSTH